jgi:hypothetical protein
MRTSSWGASASAGMDFGRTEGDVDAVGVALTVLRESDAA